MPGNSPLSNDPLSGLLGALLGGHPAVQEHMQNTGQSLDDVLGTLSNSANTPPADSPTGSSLGDILGSMTGGAPQGGGAPAAGAGGDPLSAILGGLLGGGMQGGTPGAGGDPLSAILGGLLGGGMLGGMQGGTPGAGGDPLSAILGGLLGGGMQGGMAGAGALGNNAFLAPIVESIASKIGIPPEIAGTVISFALSQLMSREGGSGQLAQMLGSRGSVSQKYLRDSGLASQLAAQTGMDNKTAVKSLQQVLQAFGTQMGEGTTEDRQQGLQSWLETK
ncbi:MAG: hypothetical protein ACM3S0_11515 [Acidobacteriota bacterium]